MHDEKKKKQKKAAPLTASTGRAKKGSAKAPEAVTPKAKPRKTATTRAAARPAVAQEPALSIVMVTSEAHPFAKTGGLAEVAGALPDALARLGHSVTIVLPRYRGVSIEGAESRNFTVSLGSHQQAITVYERVLGDNVVAALIDVPQLFDRDGLYGTPAGDFPDNAWRFAVFSRAALEYVRVRGKRPSLIHAHDWQAGLVPVYQKMELSNDPVVGGVPVVFTIHNLAFQGMFPADILPHIGLGWEVLNMQAMEHWGRISFLKGGINFSEKITTVSPTYAKEIVQPELGFGFDGVLARRASDLVGILNGIDTSRWNPEHDAFVPVSFTAENLPAKRDAKRALLQAVGLPSDDDAMRRPLIGVVSRLTDQKGLDIFASAAESLMKLDAAWAMLGSGETRYEDLFQALGRRFPQRVSATIGFDERLAHLIEAGSDLFLMPSRFEPCGLNQMYSFRYGTVPVVRATGGLDDTVIDAAEASNGSPNGFKFHEYTPRALQAALERALVAYQDEAGWRRLQLAGMSRDSSWDGSAREYVKVYRAIALP